MNFIIKNTTTGLFIIGKKLGNQVLLYEGSLLDAAGFGSKKDADAVVKQITSKQPETKLEVMKIYRDENKNIKVEKL